MRFISEWRAFYDPAGEALSKRTNELTTPELVAESGKSGERPSGAAGANFFGGAVWGNFRENANCGDPPG